ncbi:hypothetical protein [Mycobacteroides abscessus]|uniref:hypothetical protein n=1 Tax=Mycobacteroides abscessus TaxID=36809 RepID=UPI0009429981|nr:hypothetical protein [Mycobacteroides abscessus]MBN7322837.1 hypothetical protein [Mycobacteroides abscessus subsp. massiliense]MBN7388187.1 hypothetical protein [Mycobacteroides abscessus subsp. abscessus]MBN7417668.1 hypothetical protein [Mycobacteroides abscessus subsp. abscessus]MBN7488743.1 hypothetical protein [Mycobacteroides abscessus subsp. abscessus]MBN7503092.1 hypothetical protein [Mycobacteroides abscessus subsp. abscessus]
MDQLLRTVAVLACPVAMAAMMWMMMSGDRSDRRGAAPADPGQLHDLRADIERLKHELSQKDQTSMVGSSHGVDNR